MITQSMMENNILFLFALYTATVFSALMSTLPPSHGQNYGDSRFRECQQFYSCGNLTKIQYPFSGNGRPVYCGHPGFELECINDRSFIHIVNQNFLVLDIISSPPDRLYRMTLARNDLLENPCSSNYTDTKIDTTLFSFTQDHIDNVTVHFGCQWKDVNKAPSNYSFMCDDQDDTKLYAFYEAKNNPHANAQWIGCMSSTVVPVILNPMDDPAGGEDALKEALDRGFAVYYKVDWTQCLPCMKSGGYCGSDDQAYGEFSCICETGQSSETCPPTFGNGGQIKRKLILALSAAGLASLFTGTIVCCFCLTSKSKKTTTSTSINCWRTRKNNHHIETFLQNHGPLGVERYSFSDVKKMTNRFKTKLGEGGYGSVYKGKLPTGTLIAVKLLNKSKSNGQDFINEVASISRTSHVNIVTLVGFCLESNNNALIYEYMCSGSLDKLIYQKKPCDIDTVLVNWQQLHQIAIGIARGLEYLHRGCNTRILHFDIKPHNILLDERFCPKISDFGLSKICPKRESTISTLEARGTIGYIAPEVFNRNFGRPSYKSDIYSYGMMVLEMVGVRKNLQLEVSHSSEMYFPDWIYKLLEFKDDLGLGGVMTTEDYEIARKMIVVGLWCAQTIPSDRPSITKVIEMLEGNLESLQIPPRPSLSSPPRPIVKSETTSVI